MSAEKRDPALASERVARFHLPGRVHIDLEFTAMRARARHTRIVATGSPPAANDTTYRKRARATPVRSRKLTLVWRMARSTSAASRAPKVVGRHRGDSWRGSPVPGGETAQRH